MKKIFTLLTLFFAITSLSKAQTNVLCENFSSYDSTTATADYNGWTLTYYSQFSYYTSIASSGPSGPNSYKFGVDSATAISPNIAGADHINFWMKGNAATGHTLANGAFYIYETSDGTNWNLIDMINPIPAGVAQTVQYALSPGTTNVKFFYDKDSGNVAFDDFCATIGAVGINEVGQQASLSVYPNPTKGFTSIDLMNMHSKSGMLTVSNVLGKVIRNVQLKGTENTYQFDLSEFPDGVYFIKLKNSSGEKTQRILLRK
jgi:hypothetical protein